MRLLVTEDDDNLRVALEAALRGVGFAVDTAADLPAADEALWVNAYDAVVFDRMLPSGDALPYVRSRRQAGWLTPVLFLTARDALADRVDGLRVGGGDYLVKPFAMPEFLARVVSLCRRAPMGAGPGERRPTVLRCADVALDQGRHEVRRAGVLLMLTRKQFLVLERLLTTPGVPVSRRELLGYGWDEAADSASNVLDALINQLRRKLGDPPLIETVRGIGYVIRGR